MFTCNIFVKRSDIVHDGGDGGGGVKLASSNPASDHDRAIYNSVPTLSTAKGTYNQLLMISLSHIYGQLIAELNRFLAAAAGGGGGCDEHYKLLV